MAKKAWVDYQEIKSKISLEMILAHYHLLEALKPSGKNLVGCCPIHKGTNPRQFSVNLERNVFNCFGDCQSGGNVIDFVAKMEKVELREAALLLQNWFLSGSSQGPQRSPPEETKAPASPKSRAKLVRKEKTKAEKEEADKPVNPPLTFELKSITTEHPFFAEKGITPATVERFGLAFCLRGMMKDRIVIPIHNQVGELVAYCGRAVEEEQIKEEKYKLPPNFVKSAVVYNLHRQEAGAKTLILVESFLSVFQLYQAEFENAVALMGSVLSDEQENLIVDFLGPSGQVILLFDADDSGRKCAADCLERLGKKLFVRAVDISSYGKKPHQLDPEILKKIL